MGSRFSLLLLFCVVACSSDGAAPPPAYEAENEGTSMADTPWPSDAFLHNGKIHVDSIPGLEGQKGPLDALAATLSDMDGASIYTSVFFPIKGTLVDGALEGKATWTDLDDKHSFETNLWMRAQTNELVALAPKDEILTAGHKYSVVVRAPSVTPSAKMKDALTANGAPADASAITVFTVGHPTPMVDRMHEVSAARPPPTAKVTKTLRGADLEDFAGTPTTTHPGLGDPKGIVHDQLDAVILGTFDAPSFLSATPPQLGLVEVDASGAPIVKGTEPVPFLLTLPKNIAPGAKVPILVFQHGLNAGRAQVMTCANDYARAGYATIGVDAIWHGDRAPKRKDEVHNFSGAPGPDGLADNDDFGAAVNLFDFGGDDARGIAKFDGRYVRDNFRQAINDVVELVRFVRFGDLSATGVAFDGEHIVYTSESFGSVIGTSVVAVSPDLAGAVLSVAGGGIFLPMFPNSPTFNGILTPFLKTSFDPYIDLSDPKVLPGEAMRSLSLLEAAFSGGDSLAFAPLIRERKRNVLVLQARSDELIPNQATELMMRAIGATSVTLPSKSEPPRFVTLPIAPAPYQGDGNTIAVIQLSPALHTVFTTFTGERKYEPEFPPFITKDPPEIVENPIELAHGLALAFVDSLRNGGPGKVQSP